MILKGKTNDWPEFAEEMIRRFFQNTNINIYIGQSINAQCQMKKDRIRSIDLVLIYDAIVGAYVAWDTVIHQNLHAGEKVMFSIGKILLRNNVSDKIEFVRHELSGTNGQEATSERVAIIPRLKLYDFLENISHFYNFFESDDSDNSSLLNFQRKVDEVTRKRRDPRFRERILDEYNYTCAICGETENVVLEAAHIIGVGDGGDDGVENGVCLCANHHKMFDAALLDIDFTNKTFQCNSETCLNAPWYCEAQERNFKLFVR